MYGLVHYLGREIGAHQHGGALTGEVVPERRDRPAAARADAGEQFVVPCHRLHMFGKAVAVIDGSKFKAPTTAERSSTAPR